MVEVAVGCPMSKKEKVRDTAVSQGKARVEVSSERHMYSTTTPTIVWRYWKYGCYDARCTRSVDEGCAGKLLMLSSDARISKHRRLLRIW